MTEEDEQKLLKYAKSTATSTSVVAVVFVVSGVLWLIGVIIGMTA